MPVRTSKKTDGSHPRTRGTHRGAKLPRKYRLYIDGRWLEAGPNSWSEAIEPFSGECWAKIPLGSTDDLDAAVLAAHRAFNSGPWPSTMAIGRGALLRKLAMLFERDAARLGRIEQLGSGRPIKLVAEQPLVAAQWLRFYAGLAERELGRVMPTSGSGVLSITKPEPLGVVALIAQKQSSLVQTILKVAPVLAAGNTLVLALSKNSLGSAFELAALCEEAGMPPGVVNVISGLESEIAERLSRLPLISKVALVGSAGRRVFGATTTGLSRSTTDCGGRLLSVVFDDADVDLAVNGVVAGFVGGSCETAITGSHLLLQAGIYDQFIGRMAAELKNVRVGDPLDPLTAIGPIATRAQFDRVLAFIDMAKREGATCIFGGHLLTGAGYGQGQFVAPTVFSNVHGNMRILHEDVFGPVLCVIRFETDEEAVRIANAIEPCLAAAVWTSNLHRAVRSAERIRADLVWINDHQAHCPPPSGGLAASGIGAEAGVAAMGDYLRSKSIWISSGTARAAAPRRADA
jgi:(Z)-2-((N-methylformamido)methylene)-5-hydroxybutyrolactone dehydrogenase